GQRQEAGARLEKSLGLFRQLAENQPEVPRYRRMQAWGQQLLGTIYLRDGKSAEAREAFQDATALWEKLVAADPDRAAYAASFAGMFARMMPLVDETSPPAEALAWYDRSLKRLSELWQRLAKQKHEPALANLQHWQGLLRLGRACCKARAGEHAGPAAEADAVVAAAKKGVSATGDTLFLAARCQALCAAAARKDTQLTPAGRAKLAERPGNPGLQLPEPGA